MSTFSAKEQCAVFHGLSKDVGSLLVMVTGCVTFWKEFYSEVSRIWDELLVTKTCTGVTMIWYKAYQIADGFLVMLH